VVGVAETLGVRIVSFGESETPVGLRRQVREIRSRLGRRIRRLPRSIPAKLFMIKRCAR
jgi:hypothetical protein